MKAMSDLQVLPLVTDGSVSTRTAGDRLELLTALITAPNFDPLFRTDVIKVPRDHPTYGWGCAVSGCQRAQGPARDFCKVHELEWVAAQKAGQSITEFHMAAVPLIPKSRIDPPPCVVCPDAPAWDARQLCYLHGSRWLRHHADVRGRKGMLPVYEECLAKQVPFPHFGQCKVLPCPEQASSPLGLCHRHITHYERDRKPGGARPAANWARWIVTRNKPVPIEYADRSLFERWCRETGLANRANGQVSLLGLRPLVKAEIKWALFQHGNNPTEGMIWPLVWVQYLIDDCRDQRVDSLADIDQGNCRRLSRLLLFGMLNSLRQVYFTRDDTKEAGFIETDHFGVRFASCHSQIDLTPISQRWLRDLIWDMFANRLLTDPPKSRSPFDMSRRACAELSAYLEAQAPGGGHDPTVLTASHMEGFVADQRHRAEHGLPMLGRRLTKNGAPGIVTKCIQSATFNGARRVLRFGLDSGDAERLGLDRRFALALPGGDMRTGRRRPFPDVLARAVANQQNLERLEESDEDDRGIRDIWETQVLTGRRGKEVREVRLDCISRLNGVPLFWHDQTKVGNLDEAIRIPERLYLRLEQRQKKTIDRYIQRVGHPPTPQERSQIALFPRRTSNRQLLKSVSYKWFLKLFRTWLETLDVGHGVPHQARHTLATKLLKAGANLTQIKRYLGQISAVMAEHYVHIANTDSELNDALNSVWVAGPGAAQPGLALTSGKPMTRAEAEALAIDLSRKSTPAEGGFCTFQAVVDGQACPWNMDCHNCDKFVMSGADLVYWHRKREQWHAMAEGASDSATADYLHDIFEPTARAIDGLEKALEAVGLLDEALALDLRRPQEYFGRVWATAFRAQELAQHQTDGTAA
ncbi:tyrosine-type recombinase/integrase [Streptomyces diastaticus]